MSSKESVIPKVTDKITFLINEAIRDAVEYMEGDNIGDVAISVHGVLKMWEDGHREFLWKGKVAIVFKPLTRDKDDLVLTYDKLYLEDNNEQSGLTH